MAIQVYCEDSRVCVAWTNSEAREQIKSRFDGVLGVFVVDADVPVSQGGTCHGGSPLAFGAARISHVWQLFSSPALFIY